MQEEWVLLTCWVSPPTPWEGTLSQDWLLTGKIPPAVSSDSFLF